MGGFTSEVAPASWYKYGFVIIVCFGYFFFPLFGLLADVWIIELMYGLEDTKLY